jgi:hypothetical protein
VGFVEGETVYCNDTCVTCDVDGTEEVSIKVEEAIDMKEEVCVNFEAIYLKDETLDAAIFPPIKTEQEVRLWGVFVKWWQLMLLGHLLPKKEILMSHFTVSFFCVM